MVRGRPRKQVIRVPEGDETLLAQMPGLWNHYTHLGTEKSRKSRIASWFSFSEWLRLQLRRKEIEVLDSLYIFIGQDAREANLIAEAYSNALKKKEYAAATINKRISDLQTLVKQARKLGLVNWTLEVQRQKVDRYATAEGPTFEEIKTVLEHNKSFINEETKFSKRLKYNRAIRDRAIFSLHYPLALRPQEVASVRIEDVDLERKTIKVTNAKMRDQPETLSLPEFTIKCIEEWLNIRGRRQGMLFRTASLRYDKKVTSLSERSVKEIIYDMGRAVGIKISPRGLRHTAITEVMKDLSARGLPIEEGLKFSRHKSVDVLLIYRDRIQNRQGEFATNISKDLNDLLA